ncbi:MAG: PP2C family protein-serine/threonine phosphatase [Planctomycetota bacterium]|nr:PP2C family protein-serine/threonine phosphatase [Planctomycetota bacterium]
MPPTARPTWQGRSGAAPYIAAFFIFAPAGYLITLIQTKPWTWAAGTVLTLFAGCMAMGWSVVFTDIRRLWWLLVPLNVAPFFLPQFLMRTATELGISRIGSDLSELANRIICGVLTVVMVSIGWTLMVRFLIRTESRTARLKTEMALASRIHRGLVPPLHVRTPHYEVLGRSDPSSEMGGDLIDAVVREGAVDVYLADVSGHGVRAGVLMAMLKSALRTALLHKSSGPALGEIARDLNRVVCQLAEPDMFVTFACVRLTPGAPAELALAGHLPTLIVARDGSVRECANENLPLGVDPDERFATLHAEVHPGDTVVMLTDGFIEPRDAAGRQFGLARVRDQLSRTADQPLERMAASLFDAVAAFAPRDDDQSLVMLRII